MPSARLLSSCALSTTACLTIRFATGHIFRRFLRVRICASLRAGARSCRGTGDVARGRGPSPCAAVVKVTCAFSSAISARRASWAHRQPLPKSKCPYERVIW